MSSDLKALTRQLYRDVFSEGKLDEVIDEYFDENFVEHEELPPGIPGGREAPRALFKMMLNAFPDFHAAIDDIIQEDDMVMVRARFSGTHEGEFMGIPATGNKFEIAVFDQLRYADGRLTEHWGLMDNMAMMQQLGIIEAAPPG